MVYNFITNPKTLVPNTLAKAEDVNAIVNAIFLGLQDISAKIQIGQLLVTDIQYGGLTPIGSIIPFYDYNGVLTFDTDYWAYCDGSVVSINGTNYTLPDLSGRYIVGFGTPGGGNIDTATWETTAVGNTAHKININHYHTVNSHNHSIAGHSTSAGTSHTHGVGTLKFKTGYFEKDDQNIYYMRFYDNGGALSSPYNFKYFGVSSGSGTVRFWGLKDSLTTSSVDYYTASGSGSTSSESSHTHTISVMSTLNTSPNTNSQLSTTQSIQPESIRVRYIMRIA